ncbi:unnamed protein product [Cladocopium goreaui]|uniref:N-acetyltransferase domain-containing protein n=1 Tax=Cladocopium goreaui TaxID=2562237 RepID=A0A9P1GLT0_9DINO|nr:unnamed protein product [Cladocopium goreaui]
MLPYACRRNSELAESGASATDFSNLFQAAMPLALVAPAHLYVLNRSYGRHSLVIMSPSMGASSLLCNVLTGYLLYGEVPMAAIEFSVGIALICLGILSLMTLRSKSSTVLAQRFNAAVFLRCVWPRSEMWPQVSCVVDANLDAKAWANITSLSEKEVFLQALVKELHGSVVSDAGLKSYALVAPSEYNLLLSQLKTQLWLCGGDTGRPCDAPVANWQNVVGGKDPQKTAAFAQNLLRWRGMEVSDEQAFLAWARSPPEDLNAALDQHLGILGPQRRKAKGCELRLWWQPTVQKLREPEYSSHSQKPSASPWMSQLSAGLVDFSTPALRDEAIELLVAAFNDEPSFRWVVGTEAGSEGQYLRYVRWLAALAVHVILAVRGLSLAVREDGEDGEDQMLGVALLIPPETRLEDVGLAELTKTSGVGLPPFHRSFRSKKVQVSWGRAARRRERALSTITRDTHRQLANMPHWYLWFLAVKPHVQGRGVGTLLLDEIQKLQDRDVFPCYLDSGWV